MIRLTVHPVHPKPAAIEAAAQTLRSGGIVAMPTDTLYGLAVDPRDGAAVRRVFAAKGRGADRALPLVAADEAQVAATLGPLGPAARMLARRFWPGPLTLLVPVPLTVAAEAVGGLDSIGVRVPAHEVPRAVCRAVGWPLTATSANRSGQPPSRDPAAVVASVGNAVDLVLDAGLTPGGRPSTIVDVTGTGLRLVRPGAIEWETIQRCLDA